MLILNFLEKTVDEKRFLPKLNDIILKKFIFNDYELDFVDFIKFYKMKSFSLEKAITAIKTMYKYFKFVDVQNEIPLKDIKPRTYWYFSMFKNFFEDIKNNEAKDVESIIEIYKSASFDSLTEETETLKKVNEKINKSFKDDFQKLDEKSKLIFKQNLFYLYAPCLLNLRPSDVFRK